MKSKTEIQRAHDILVPVVTGEIEIEMDAQDKHALHYATDVLCWILRHEHNRAFEENLFNLEAELSLRGYVLEEETKK